jgi:uncharacterized membrane protein YtjA (UPF0391 family)
VIARHGLAGGGIAMWIYAVAIFGIALVAEAVGLGGLPAQAVEIENILFVVLLITLIAALLRRAVKR